MNPSIRDIMVVEEKQLCLVNNLMNFCMANGLRFDSEWLLIALGCVGFTYAPNEFEMEMVTGRSKDFTSIFTCFHNCLAGKLNTKKFYSVEDMKTFMAAGSGNTLYLLHMDQFYIRYSPNYLQNHFDTYVLLSPWSNDKVPIYDNGFHELASDVFAQAASLDTHISVFFAADDLAWTNEREMLQGGLQKIIQAFYDAPTPTCPHMDRFVGLRGMQQFSAHFKDGFPQSVCKSIYAAINRSGSVVQSRLSAARFFCKHRDGGGIAQFSDCGMAFEELADKWRKIANLTFRLSENSDSALRERIYQRILDVIGMEQKGIEKLEQITQLIN